MGRQPNAIGPWQSIFLYSSPGPFFLWLHSAKPRGTLSPTAVTRSAHFLLPRRTRLKVCLTTTCFEPNHAPSHSENYPALFIAYDDLNVLSLFKEKSELVALDSRQQYIQSFVRGRVFQCSCKVKFPSRRERTDYICHFPQKEKSQQNHRAHSLLAGIFRIFIWLVTRAVRSKPICNGDGNYHICYESYFNAKQFYVHES